MKLPEFKNLTEKFHFQFFALLAAVFLFVGTPVPSSNEYSYLLRLRKVYDANYLANDLTFSTPTNEYWLFDHVFGLLTFIFSIKTIGWIGRICCWSILLYALMKLGKRWKIPVWMISASIFLWLYVGQSIIANEWMFGGFEAKCAAYICLIFALERFCDEKDVSSAILLGLSFAFHPVVGLWGIAAAIPALFIRRKNLAQTLKIVLISGAFSLIGAIPLLLMRAESVPPTTENLKFFELVKFPFHFDPFSWSRSEILLICLMMIFCVSVQKQIKQAKPNVFLFAFLTFLFAFFLIGFLLRAFDQYELMEFTPTRLFAVFIPLFFFFYLFKAFQAKIFKEPFLITVSLLILFLSLWATVPLRGISQITETVRAWNQQPDDYADAFVWLKNNTPDDSITIAPPWRYDFWYLSERAEVVNYRKPIIADVGEWQNRLENLTGKAAPENGYREEDELKNFYFNLNKETIDSLAKKYNAEYFISTTDYPYPIAYSKGDVKVYRLPPKP